MDECRIAYLRSTEATAADHNQVLKLVMVRVLGVLPLILYGVGKCISGQPQSLSTKSSFEVKGFSSKKKKKGRLKDPF